MTRFVALLTLCIACGGNTVSPIDPRDPNLPPQTREAIAGAQDAVVAARARQGIAERELSNIERWADETGERTPSGGVGDALEALADARVDRAEAELKEAEKSVELAEATLELTYAERAVNDDIATYELEPIRLRVEAIQEDLNGLRRERLAARQRELEANRSWWESYSSYTGGGGDTSRYWLGERDAIGEVEEVEASESGESDAPPAGDAGDDEASDEAEEEEGDEEGDDDE
ncbi:MAG: hypothetical protein AAF411_31790 [Myxococcota bacterium]